HSYQYFKGKNDSKSPLPSLHLVTLPFTERAKREGGDSTAGQILSCPHRAHQQRLKPSAGPTRLPQKRHFSGLILKLSSQLPISRAAAPGGICSINLSTPPARFSFVDAMLCENRGKNCLRSVHSILVLRNQQH
ncbi:hypothetical protein ACJ73_07660, partial [Blastomyces percursus]